MPKLFPDSTRLGRATRNPMPMTANPTKPINDSAYESISATGGTRTLTYRSVTDGSVSTTADLAYDASAATIKAAFDALASAVADGVTVVVGQTTSTGATGPEDPTEITLIKNTYNFTDAGGGSIEVGHLTVDGTNLTGGSAVMVEGSSFNGVIAREATQDALRAKGMLRSSSQVSNDIEKMNQRKPKDIGDPDRIPGER